MARSNPADDKPTTDANPTPAKTKDTPKSVDPLEQFKSIQPNGTTLYNFVK